MHMAGTADLFMVPFGQEGRGMALLPSDFLDPVFGDRICFLLAQGMALADPAGSGRKL